MDNYFFVHIGLHKTATTSLQKDIFPFLDGVRFLGRSSQALKFQSSLYKEICEFCFRKTLDENSIPRIKRKLKESLAKSSLILSEEWFTADYSGFFGFRGASWQDKIDRLSILLEGFSHKILVTVREPVKGLYSQYCEFSPVGISELYSGFNEYALHSNDSFAYCYSFLNSFLTKRFSNVEYFSFDSLITGRSLKRLAKVFNLDLLPELGHHNVKLKNNSGTFVISHHASVRLLASLTPLWVKTHLKRIRFLNTVKTKILELFSRQIIVEHPPEDLLDELHYLYSESNCFYQKIIELEMK